MKEEEWKDSYVHVAEKQYVYFSLKWVKAAVTCLFAFFFFENGKKNQKQNVKTNEVLQKTELPPWRR
jgi:hypothetical protein